MMYNYSYVSCSATYCRNFSFPFELQGREVDMVFSSVAGHLLELDFEPPYNSWRGCAPRDLYEAPVKKQVSKGEGQKIKKNLQNLARRASHLILWLDCDREGENIAFEVLHVCREVNPRIQVKRARFSALIHSDIFRAVNNLVAPNENESLAVDARQEIDLRIGSSFTRLQTLLLQDAFDWSSFCPPDRDRMLFSYGPCQFPTLGLIVQREWEIQSHIFEAFWTINVHYKSATDGSSAVFKWARGNIFDQQIATLYHELCTRNPEATVTDVSGNQRRRHAPFPLCTLELQKKGSQYLRMSGERIMKIAEELYQGGFISYPRTETTLYSQGYDLKGLVKKQSESQKPWSAYAGRLLESNTFRWPQSGGKDDGAHPPIHPTKPYDNSGQNSQEKAKVYDFVVRHFLASCSPDALGQETKITIDVAGEQFSCTGLVVLEKNWLEIFPWANWGGDNNLPHLQRHQTFQPQQIQLHEGTTQPPPRLRETDLLAKMDEYGIGTDATVADHIAKQLERGYAVKDSASMTFSPTALGESLISAYRKMGLENLWLPTLRGVIEQNIDAVARGVRTKDQVLSEAVQSFKRDFTSATQQSNTIKEEVRAIVFQGEHGGGENQARVEGQHFAPCSCGSSLVLAENEGVFTVACQVLHSGPSSKICFPRRVTRSITISDQDCQVCGEGTKMLTFTFDSGLLPPHLRHRAHFSGCMKCNNEVAQLLRSTGFRMGSSGSSRGRGHGQGRGRGRARGRARGRSSSSRGGRSSAAAYRRQ